jgi:hypothetical protein
MTFLTETISIARAPWDVPFWGQHVIYYSVIFFVDLAAVLTSGYAGRVHGHLPGSQWNGFEVGP